MLDKLYEKYLNWRINNIENSIRDIKLSNVKISVERNKIERDKNTDSYCNLAFCGRRHISNLDKILSLENKKIYLKYKLNSLILSETI